MTKAASLVASAKQWAGYYGKYPNGEESVVLSVPLQLRAAWDSGDADALADVFTEDGSMLIDDDQLSGRDEIRAYLAESFTKQHKDTRVTDEPVEIRFLMPGVALAITKGGLIGRGEQELAEENEVRTTWVVHKVDGEWKLVSHQTSPIKG